MSSGAAGAAAAQQAAMINATRSFGIISTVDPDEFMVVVGLQDSPLVIAAIGGFFVTDYRYLVSYKGLAFYTKSPYPLELPPGTEIVRARKLLLPGI